MLTQEKLKEILDYDSETGFFYSKFRRGPIRAGDRVGSPTGHGYRKVGIGYSKYYEHHLAWLYIYGEWPEEIDHEDRNRSNNAIGNLRLATRTDNCHNADRCEGRSGLRGAYLNTRTTRWFSQIKLGDRQVWLGTFDTPEEAHEAYKEAAKLHHGEFYLHNREILTDMSPEG